jgi:hypothetical protein
MVWAPLASVNPTFEPNQTQAGRDNAELALLIPFNDDNPQNVRVKAAQQLLFPANPCAICQEMGLNWWAALKLHQDGWLSFPPDRTPQLDEAQETELRFVGALVIGGCDHNMLNSLLCTLPKPYAYDPRRLYYDWSVRRWRVLLEPHSNPEAVFADWLEALVQTCDISTLTGIDELAHDALARVRRGVEASEALPEAFTNWHVTADEEDMQG